MRILTAGPGATGEIAALRGFRPMNATLPPLRSVLFTSFLPPRHSLKLAYGGSGNTAIEGGFLSIFGRGSGAKIKFTTTEAGMCMKTKGTWTRCPQISGHLLPL